MTKKQTALIIAGFLLCFSLPFFIIGHVLFIKVPKTGLSGAPAGFVIVEAQVLNTGTYKTEGTSSDGGKVIETHYTADVKFEYDGETFTHTVTGNPLLKTGGTTEIYFHPTTREIKNNYSDLETIFTSFLYIPSIACFALGGILFLVAVLYAAKKLSFYREKNRISGTITEITETVVPGGTYLKTVICTFYTPDTGVPVTISTTTKHALTLSPGQSVPVYYNKKTPTSSVIDM